MRRIGPQLPKIALWAVAGAVTAGLAYQRYHAAVGGGIGADFLIFVRAARQIAAGHTPYATRDFVYPPTFALALAPVSQATVSSLWKTWTALELAALTAGVALFVSSQSRQVAGWLRPVLFIFCSITVLHFWPVSVGLFLGQSDAFTFAALLLSTLAASRSWPATRGTLLGVAGLFKAWPAATVISLLQRGLDRRRRAAIAFVITVLLVPVMTVASGGMAGLTGFFRSVFAAGGQHLVSDSVWGAPDLLFARSGLARPVFVSSPLQIAVTVILAAWVVGLLVATLRTIGDPVLCTWNAMFCIILLLPVSHLAYSLYALPVLWWWAARLLGSRRFDAGETVAFVALLAWWLVMAKAWPDTGSSPGISSVRYSIVFAADLVACTISVIVSRRLSGDRSDHADGAPPDRLFSARPVLSGSQRDPGSNLRPMAPGDGRAP